MIFEERDIKPYAEPVEPNDLQVGDDYYSVQFIFQNPKIPIMESLIFLGWDLEPNDNKIAYFQDAESYYNGVRYETASNDDVAIFYSQPADQLNHIFLYERALERLMFCSLER